MAPATFPKQKRDSCCWREECGCFWIIAFGDGGTKEKGIKGVEVEKDGCLDGSAGIQVGNHDIQGSIFIPVQEGGTDHGGGVVIDPNRHPY